MRLIRTAAALVILLVAIAGFAQASDGDPLILGQQNTAESTTTITSTVDPGTALFVDGGEEAIVARCAFTNCTGIVAMGISEAGISARDAGGVGVEAAGLIGVEAHGTSVGVGGTGGSIGVSGGGAVGVSGRGAVGVEAIALGPDATALTARGPTTFNRSGIVTVPAGVSTVKVTLDTPQGDLSPGALVLATVQQRGAGVFVRAAAPHPTDASSFTIFLNKIAPVDVKVGWFIVN